jgi:N-carbamoylputrescine amidase
MKKNLLSIGLIQSSCSEHVEENFERTLLKIEALCEKGAKIICTQELFSNIYFCQYQNPDFFKLAEVLDEKNTHIKKLSQISKKNKVVILASFFEKRTEGIYHNTVVVFDHDGSVAGLYRKMHIPDDPHFNEKFYFTPGDTGYKVFKTKYANIGVLICWDQWFPEAARITALKGAQILFYPTAIGWLPSEKKEFGTKQYNAWEIIQRAHAVANGLYVASVNRVGTEKFPQLKEGIEFWGKSFICDPYGDIIEQAPHNKEAIVFANIDLSEIENTRNIWPFFRDRRIDSYKDILKRFSDDE